MAIKPLSDVLLANIFSQLVGCFFVSILFSLALKKLFSLMKSHLFILSIVRSETIRFLEENIGSIPFDIRLKRIFLDIMSSQTRETTERINKSDFITLKSFYKARENRIETKTQSFNWEKIFANHISEKQLISITYEEHTQLDNKKSNNPIKKRAEDMNRHFSKEDTQMANRHMKRCSSSLITREVQIKTTLRYHLTPVRMANITKN
uniref:Uncharacterized protein n=1 Tax=Equus caballus TaxID=9796 RepID=A0A9L0SGM5_HORSE